MGTGPDVGERFLDALAARDYAAVAGCFAPEAIMRAVVPSRVRVEEGADAIAERFRVWTARIGDFALVEAEVAPFADVLRLRWVMRGTDPDDRDRPIVVEQVAYADVEDGRIADMRLACSGDRAPG